MSSEIYQLKISLNHIAPQIWRQIQVDSNIVLPDLHKIIQIVMGWTNSHLHHFIKGSQFYCIPNEESFDDLDEIDYSNIKLSDLLSKEKENIFYEYDFGDSWEHTIKLEKILPVEKDNTYPVCLAGKRNCPPEDCGGVIGYGELLIIINDPEDEEYESMMEWLDGEFDPEYIDLAIINMHLQEKNFGILY